MSSSRVRMGRGLCGHCLGYFSHGCEYKPAKSSAGEEGPLLACSLRSVTVEMACGCADRPVEWLAQISMDQKPRGQKAVPSLNPQVTHRHTPPHVYSHIHAYSHACAHSHTCIFTHTPMHIHTKICTSTHMDTHSHILSHTAYAHSHTCTFTYTHAHVHSRTHVHSHTHAYTVTHTHTYTLYMHTHRHAHSHTFTDIYTYEHTRTPNHRLGNTLQCISHGIAKISSLGEI